MYILQSDSNIIYGMCIINMDMVLLHTRDCFFVTMDMFLYNVESPLGLLFLHSYTYICIYVFTIVENV